MALIRTPEHTAVSWQMLWRSDSKRAAVRKVVLGLGSTPLGDERLGFRSLPYLKSQLSQRSRVEWIDGRPVGMNLFSLVEQCSHLLVVDAVDAGRQPGELVDMSLLRLLRPVGFTLSRRQAMIQDALGLAQVLGQAPANFRLVGLQPGPAMANGSLSQPAAAGLPALRQRVEAVLEDWGLMG